MESNRSQKKFLKIANRITILAIRFEGIDFKINLLYRSAIIRLCLLPISNSNLRKKNDLESRISNRITYSFSIDFEFSCNRIIIRIANLRKIGDLIGDSRENSEPFLYWRFDSRLNSIHLTIDDLIWDLIRLTLQLMIWFKIWFHSSFSDSILISISF